jgi:hypothetical protein
MDPSVNTKRRRTMLLVACAFGPTANAIVACGSGPSGCIGFYACDGATCAEPPDAPAADVSGCFGFYPCDAYANCVVLDASDEDAPSDAKDADAEADGDTGARE